MDDAVSSRRADGRRTLKIPALIIVLIGFAVFFTGVFSPVLFSGRYATGGDGLLQALPTFLGRAPLWEPNLMMGYPLFADPNQAFWYPVSRLLRIVPGSFNAYVVLPYVVGSFGVAAFARLVTRSTAGGVAAGTIFGLGGFMISHQGHVNLIHTAAWAPYVLWAVEELRRRPRFSVVALGSGAFAMSALAGSQQPLAYVALVALAYAIVFPPETAGRTRYLVFVGLLFAFGIGLSAIATIPAIELTHESARAGQTYAQFIAFSTGPSELPVRAFFPYFLGATASPWYPYSATNVGAFSETTNYAGIFSLLLATVALMRGADRRQISFWTCVVVWAAWMSLGGALFGARIAYHIPIYGLFRIPARHAFELTLGIALLAAFGVRTLETRRLALRDVILAAAPVCIVFVTVLVAVAVAGDAIRTSVQDATGVASSSLPPLPVGPFQNPAIVMPCFVVVCSCLMLFALRRSSRATLTGTLCVVIVAFDMLTFAGSAYWRYSTVDPSIATPPALAARIRSDLDARGQRILAGTGSRSTQSIPPNVSTLWGIASTGGYVSLEDRRLADLLEMAPTGEVQQQSFAQDDDRILDLTATRYILAPPRPASSVPASASASGPELGGFVGADALTMRKIVAYAFAPNAADTLEFVSALGLSATVVDGAHVADIEVRDDRNRLLVLPVFAGRDTSESAYDRPDVRAVVRHRKASVFSTNGTASLYIAHYALPSGRAFGTATVEWRYPDAHIGALTVAHLALVDERRKIAYPALAYPPRWTARALSADETLYDNPDALPGAWAVSSAVPLDDASQKSAIAESRFDPRATAFVPVEVPAFHGSGARDGGSVRVTINAPTRAQYAVACVARCMLVVDGLWYPGWNASVDGTPTSVTRVDYLLRGVAVGAGRHVVEMWFAPLSLMLGAGITVTSTALLGFLCLRELRISRRPKVRGNTAPLS